MAAFNLLQFNWLHFAVRICTVYSDVQCTMVYKSHMAWPRRAGSRCPQRSCAPKHGQVDGCFLEITWINSMTPWQVMTQNKYQNTLNICSQRQFSTHLNLPNVDLQFFDRREALIAGHGSTWSKAMQGNSEGWCTDATYMHTCRAQTAVPPLHSRGMFIDDNEAPTRKARVEELTLIWSRPHAASLTGKLSNDCSYSLSLSRVWKVKLRYDLTKALSQS